MNYRREKPKRFDKPPPQYREPSHYRAFFTVPCPHCLALNEFDVHGKLAYRDCTSCHRQVKIESELVCFLS